MQARVPTLPRTAGPGPGARAEEDEADVPGRHLLGRPVWLIAVLAALLRVPYLHAPMSPDEGGFLIVAHHWHSGGGSLYGPYWVDRPPLLIALFRVADLLGGLTALRVIGCLAVGVAVLGVGLAAAAAAPGTRVARRASVWASAVAAALLVAPTGGAVMVNGELLATPFIAFGVAFTIRAVRDHQGWIGPRVSAVLAGACAVAAAMVKQNMIDVVVFGAVLGLVAALRHVITVPALLRRVGLAVAGGVAAFAVVLVGAAMRGTTPGALYFAMYPFRLRAAQVMAQNPSDARSQQFSNMVGQWVVTGAPIIIVAFLAVLLLRGPGRGRFALPLAVATVALTAYDVVSICVGGSYWSHYILQLVVPTALMTGMLLGSVPRIGRVVAAFVLVCSSVGWVEGFTARVPAAGPTVGAAIRNASSPGDTIVSVLGDGVLVRTSGLESPYRYLWSLPAHVLDHHFQRLNALLDSPGRPSWVVVRGGKAGGELGRLGISAAVHAHYQPVAEICGRQVYLRDDLTRDVPRAPSPCWLPLVSWNPTHATHNWSVTEGAMR